MGASSVDLFDKSLSIDKEYEEQMAKNQKKSDALILKDEYDQVVGFILKDELFGINILNVEEIIKPVNFTHVPNTKPFVKGVVNIRGKIIPIVDLGLKLGLEKKAIDAESRIIVISQNEYTVGFIVDRIEKVYYIEKKSIEATPSNIPQTIEKYVKGVGKMDSKIITLLNIENLLKEGGGLS